MVNKIFISYFVDNEIFKEDFIREVFVMFDKDGNNLIFVDEFCVVM